MVRRQRYAATTTRLKKLEVRPPAAVKTRTLQKTGREDGQWRSRLVLSSRKFFEAQTETTQTTTNGSGPEKFILISALRGLKVGVHLIVTKFLFRIADGFGAKPRILTKERCALRNHFDIVIESCFCIGGFYTKNVADVTRAT